MFWLQVLNTTFTSMPKILQSGPYYLNFSIAAKDKLPTVVRFARSCFHCRSASMRATGHSVFQSVSIAHWKWEKRLGGLTFLPFPGWVSLSMTCLQRDMTQSAYLIVT
jgi:hypothetical protein